MAKRLIRGSVLTQEFGTRSWLRSQIIITVWLLKVSFTRHYQINDTHTTLSLSDPLCKKQNKAGFRRDYQFHQKNVATYAETVYLSLRAMNKRTPCACI